MATVEIATHGARLSLNGQRLRISRPEKPDAFASVEDTDLVVIEVPAVDVSGYALAALAGAGVPVMVCDGQHQPIGWLHPVGANETFTSERARRQARLPERTRQRLWRSLVRAKIQAQAGALAREPSCHATRLRLIQLSREVEAGDPANIEATAARLYWPALFGDSFRRWSDDPRTRALNFGYAVLRGIVCRGIVAAGLHPGLAIHHVSTGSGFALADDLIEPYRPLTDLIVRDVVPADSSPEDRVVKGALAYVGERAVRIGIARLRARAAIRATVNSFVRVVDAGEGKLELPEEIDVPPPSGDDA